MRLPLSRSRSKLNINYSLFGFLIPFLGMCLSILFSIMALKQVYPTRVYSMLYSDCYHQYYPFFKAFRSALLSGESLLYSWDVGLGMDYLGLISYYLGSPLNLLSVLVPEEWLLGYFTLLTPIKLGFAGLFFSIFLQKLFNKNDISIALFGSFYALCAWAMGYSWNIMWLDTFALLPLVALGTVMLLKDRKFILYTVSLCLSILINYYIGFFTCIFTLLVFICYEICRWQDWRRFWADLGLMALFSALAIGMTAILSLPTLSALGTTYSAVNEYPEKLELNIVSEDTWTGLWDAMRQVAGNMNGGLEPNQKASEGLPNIYCGICANVFAFLFLTCRQIKLRDKLCAVFMVCFINISFIIRQLDYVWHGFHFTNMIPYRFSFLYSFVMLYLGYRAWTLRRRLRLWQVLTATAMALLLVVCSNQFVALTENPPSQTLWDQFSDLLANWKMTSTNINKLSSLTEQIIFPVYNLAFLGLYLIGLLIAVIRLPLPQKADRARLKLYFSRMKLRRTIGSGVLLGVIGLELIANLVYFTCNYFPGINVSNYPKGTEDTATILGIMEELEDDTLFYRAEMTHTQTLNDGALNGYHGISTFTSSANVSTTKFMQALGYAAKDNWNRYVFEESSPVSNLFLNLKYMIERDGRVEENPYFDDLHYSGQVHLLENNAYLPLGFMTAPALAELEFVSTDRFLFQNRLLSAAVGRTVTPWTIINDEDLSVASRNVTLSKTNVTTGYTKYAAGSSSGSVYYTYTFEEAGFFCIDLNMPKKNDYTLSLDTGSGYKTLYSESYSIPQMIAVCQVDPGDKIQLTVKCAANQSGTLTIAGALLDEEVFRNCYDELSASTLELTTFETTLVEGYITCQEDGLLYTSIPQDGNWKVYVDGEEAEVTLIGEAMTGVMLKKGTHTVTFRYQNNSFIWGCVVSALCLAAFLTLCWFAYYRPKNKTGKYLGKKK